MCGKVIAGPDGLSEVASKPGGENSRSAVLLACFFGLVLSLDKVDEGESGLLMVCERRVRFEEARMRCEAEDNLQVKATLSRTEPSSRE